MANLITGLFDTEAAAENAVSQLKTLGYGQSEITIIMQDRGAAQEFAADTGSHTMEGVGTGAAIGGVIGAIIGGLLAVGSVAIPGVGLIVAGPFAAMWAGAGAGGLAGSIIGWLVGAGIPEDVAPYYERGIKAGGVVVAVSCHPGDESRVQQILHAGAVAYAGGKGTSIPSYVHPDYAARYSDLTPPPNLTTAPRSGAAYNPVSVPVRSYDQDTVSGYNTGVNSQEATRTANSVAAEQRSAERTAAEHEREARRDTTQGGAVGGTAAAAENEWDRTKTAVQNQTDKVSTGTQNTTDRISNP